MFLKKNHAKRASKFGIEVFKCLKIFIYTPNIYNDIQNLHEFRLDWNILCQEEKYHYKT